MTRRRNDLYPEPGEPVILVGPDGEPDGTDTRIRQVLSSDNRMGIHEVKDDRGTTIFITAAEVPGFWIQLTEV